MIRRLQAWRRVTTPPAILPTLVVGLVAMAVAHVVVAWILVVIFGVLRLIEEPHWLGDWRVWGGVVGMLLFVPVMVIGWWAVRLLVGSWVRAQPPDPPRPLDR